jgi:hypothetical protein
VKVVLRTIVIQKCIHHSRSSQRSIELVHTSSSSLAINKSQQYFTKQILSHILVSRTHYLYCCDLCIPVVLLAVCTNSIVLCAVSGSCCAVYTSELCVVVLMHKLRALLYVLKCRPVCFLVFALMVLSAFLLFFVQLSWIMFLHYSAVLIGG